MNRAAALEKIDDIKNQLIEKLHKKDEKWVSQREMEGWSPSSRSWRPLWITRRSAVQSRFKGMSPYLYGAGRRNLS